MSKEEKRKISLEASDSGKEQTKKDAVTELDKRKSTRRSTEKNPAPYRDASTSQTTPLDSGGSSRVTRASSSRKSEGVISPASDSQNKTTRSKSFPYFRSSESPTKPPSSRVPKSTSVVSRLSSALKRKKGPKIDESLEKIPLIEIQEGAEKSRKLVEPDEGQHHSDVTTSSGDVTFNESKSSASEKQSFKPDEKTDTEIETLEDTMQNVRSTLQTLASQRREESARNKEKSDRAENLTKLAAKEYKVGNVENLQGMAAEEHTRANLHNLQGIVDELMGEVGAMSGDFDERRASLQHRPELFQEVNLQPSLSTSSTNEAFDYTDEVMQMSISTTPETTFNLSSDQSENQARGNVARGKVDSGDQNNKSTLGRTVDFENRHKVTVSVQVEPQPRFSSSTDDATSAASENLSAQDDKMDIDDQSDKKPR